MMDLDELQSARDRERQTDKLQQLRESFYADAGAFIQELRTDRDRAAERADDPFDAPTVNRLTDEIKTAEQTVEALYEKRVGKIVKAASFAAADLPAESDGMTAEEQELFETLVADIEDNRERVLDVLAGEALDADASASTTPAGSGDAAGSREAPTEQQEPEPGVGVSAAEAMGGDATPEEETGDPERGRAEPPARGDGGTGLDRETVRITDDVGDILGVDEREYDLAEDDVVTLPSANADPLVERGAAERLD